MVEKSSEMRSSTCFLFMLNYNIWVIKKKKMNRRGLFTENCGRIPQALVSSKKNILSRYRYYTYSI